MYWRLFLFYNEFKYNQTRHSYLHGIAKELAKSTQQIKHDLRAICRLRTGQSKLECHIPIFNESNGNICYKMYVVPIYLCKHSIKPVLANIPQCVQSIQSCTPLVNKQLAPGFQNDLMTGWRHIEIRTNYANEV